MTELNASIAHLQRPARMRHLKISPTGFPVPWFVAWIDGVPDFRVADTPKIGRAVRQKLCWLCGQTLGRYYAFVIGSMCAVNRTSSEPPSHRECAEYAVVACPFLTKPRMRRNEADLPEHQHPGGIMLTRNPGVALIWVTRTYRSYRPRFGDTGAVLFEIGKPEHVAFYREGRTATREEIMESIDSGMPALCKIANAEGPEACDQLENMYREAMRLLPAA